MMLYQLAIWWPGTVSDCYNMVLMGAAGAQDHRGHCCYHHTGDSATVAGSSYRAIGVHNIQGAWDTQIFIDSRYKEEAMDDVFTGKYPNSRGRDHV